MALVSVSRWGDGGTEKEPQCRCGFFCGPTGGRSVAPPTVLVALGAVLVLASCSRAPHMPREFRPRNDLRTQYLLNNPDGPFNSQIRKGEVARGMSVIEVLASWGLPNVRQGAGSERAEYWTYFVKDPYTERVAGYQLTFQNRRLTQWKIDKNVAGLGTLTLKELIPIPTRGPTLPDPRERPGEDGVVKKKP